MKTSLVAAIFGTLTLVLAFHVGKVQGQSCSDGWFGNSCQFKCHCKESVTNSIKCNHDGSCPSGYKCESGWFGPACQYVDLAADAIIQQDIVKLTDGDDSSCLETQSYQSVILDLKNKFLFTWLRLYVSDSSNLHDVSLQLKEDANAYSYCANQRNNTISDNTIDIFCDFNALVQNVYLTGKGVNSLCSVYVSGGRNVALKQSTNQTTTRTDYFNHSKASNAVDGNTDGVYEHASCTHSLSYSPPQQKWTVEFHSQMRVNRYIIYNRVVADLRYKMDTEARLKGFIIKSFNQSQEVYNYMDRESVVKTKYIVQPDSTQDSISKVEISLNGKDRILTLCEVEIFGDCSTGKFGLRCDQSCSKYCAGDDSCYPSNGQCVYGCKKGYTGNLCDFTCPFGSFGFSCLEKCSAHCGGDRSSDHRDGTCIDKNGTPGYKGPLCNEKESTDDDLGWKIGLGVSCSLLVLVSVVCGLFLFRRKTTSSTKNGRNSPSEHDRQEYHPYEDPDQNGDGYVLPIGLGQAEGTSDRNTESRNTNSHEDDVTDHQDRIENETVSNTEGSYLNLKGGYENTQMAPPSLHETESDNNQIISKQKDAISHDLESLDKTKNDVPYENHL